MGKLAKEVGLPYDRKAVFLDRDGVINRAIIRDGKPYPARNLDELEILPSVAEALTTLKKAGYDIVVVTNQPDVGRGDLEQPAVEAIHASLLERLPIDRIEVCYHPGRGLSDCDCRKPRPGMLFKASSDLDIDLRQSWMIGDRASDIACGHAAGCQTILIGDGYGETFQVGPDHEVSGLPEAVTIILG